MKKSDAPVHVAIIPDGNRRWAKMKGFGAGHGYLRGGDYEHVKGLVFEAKRLGVKYLSLWGFSTENWERPKRERDVVFKLILNNVDKFRRDAVENKIRFRHVGRKDRLPENLISEIAKLEDETEKFDEFNVLLCLDYGGRDEIVRAVNKALVSGVKRVDEKRFSEFLDTRGIPDADLIIRTAGDHRLSGFMLFQSAYSEFYFPEVSFPDFGKKDLAAAVEEFVRRKRTFGR